MHLIVAQGGFDFVGRGVCGKVPVVEGETGGVGEYDLVGFGLKGWDREEGAGGCGVGEGVV